MESLRYPGQVNLGYHLHPKPVLFMCIGSRSVMPMASHNWQAAP